MNTSVENTIIAKAKELQKSIVESLIVESHDSFEDEVKSKIKAFIFDDIGDLETHISNLLEDGYIFDDEQYIMSKDINVLIDTYIDDIDIDRILDAI